MKIPSMRGLKRSVSALSVLELISSKKYLNGVLLCDRQRISGEGKSAPCRGGAPTWFEFDKFKRAVGCFIGKGETKTDRHFRGAHGKLLLAQTLRPPQNTCQSFAFPFARYTAQLHLTLDISPSACQPSFT